MVHLIINTTEGRQSHCRLAHDTVQRGAKIGCATLRQLLGAHAIVGKRWSRKITMYIAYDIAMRAKAHPYLMSVIFMVND